MAGEGEVGVVGLVGEGTEVGEAVWLAGLDFKAGAPLLEAGLYSAVAEEEPCSKMEGNDGCGIEEDELGLVDE